MGGAATVGQTSTGGVVRCLGDSYYMSADVSQFEPHDVVVLAYNQHVVIHAQKVCRCMCVLGFLNEWGGISRVFVNSCSMQMCMSALVGLLGCITHVWVKLLLLQNHCKQISCCHELSLIMSNVLFVDHKVWHLPFESLINILNFFNYYECFLISMSDSNNLGLSWVSENKYNNIFFHSDLVRKPSS